MEGLSGFDVAAYLRDYLNTLHVPLGLCRRGRPWPGQELGAIAYLVKPLDLPQIVPAVEAAFSRVGKEPPPPLRTPAAELDAIALAVGVLMHRYSLSRQAMNA